MNLLYRVKEVRKRKINTVFQCICASLVAQLVKNLPAMQKTWDRPLGWEDPLEEGKATHSKRTSLVAQIVKVSACNVGGPGSIPGWGRSTGEGNGNPFQYSCLENLMDRGDWWAAVHGITESRAQLIYFTFIFSMHMYRI